MRLGSAAAIALGALARNRMRSSLTTLGVVIGVAAVVTMQAMGEGATTYVQEAISGLGSDMLIAVPGASRGGFGHMSLGVPLFALSDVEAIRRDARDVAALAPVNNRTLRLVAGANNRTVTVNGVTPEYFSIREWSVASGRMLNSDDERSALLSCLIGKSVQDALFAGQDPLSQEIRVHGLACRVVGVLKSKGASAFGVDQDDVAFMPYSTFARRIAGNERASVIMASAISPDRIDAAKSEMVTILRQRRHILSGEEDDFAVRDPREIAALLESVTGILTLVLAGVAAISLIVGGIGIMNIMLVSVTERTREIGVRLAVGARSSDILSQFLVEAIVLAAIGGVLGVGVGLAAALGVARAINIPFVVPVAAMPIALSVAVLIGVLFGVFPARKAAHLNPLAALRFE